MVREHSWDGGMGGVRGFESQEGCEFFFREMVMTFEIVYLNMTSFKFAVKKTIEYLIFQLLSWVNG